MRITPLEIRQHTFDKSFRGYDTESVDAFLLSLSQEWERISEELRFSKQRLEIAEKEIIRMKEIESSLFKMLKATEDAQQDINEKAESEANLIKEKARQAAEDIAIEAQKKADMMISESENKAKFLVEEAVNDLKNYERDFKAMERYKDYLVVELKSFANDALDKVIKFEERINTRTSEAKLNEQDIMLAENLAQSLALKTLTELSDKEKFANADKPGETFFESLIEKEIDNYSPVIEVTSTQSHIEKIESEIYFEPANDYDNENIELPTAHAIVNTESGTSFFNNIPPNPEVASLDESFNETANNLMKEMKATRGRPRKLSTNDGSLPTVSSVMEEFTKDVPAAIANGGGSFFDRI